MSTSRKSLKSGWAKKAVVGLAVTSIFAIGGAATISAFQDSATSDVTISSGSIDLNINDVKSYPLTFGTAWAPGTSQTQSVTVSNQGTLPLDFSATTVGATSGELAKALDVTVKRGSETIASGKLNNLSIPSTELAANASVPLDITITWNSTGSDNDYMDANGNTTLLFSAASK